MQSAAMRYAGRGGWAKDSAKIPVSAWIGAAAVIAACAGVVMIGAAVGLQ